MERALFSEYQVLQPEDFLFSIAPQMMKEYLDSYKPELVEK